MSHVTTDVWTDDRLGRSEDAKFLETFLTKRSAELLSKGEQRAYVLNIDAMWGGGKTFFLERLRRQLANSGHLSVYVNAWEDDFADDPLLAVMAAIDGEVAKRTEKAPVLKRAWTKAKKSGGRAAWLFGGGVATAAVDVAITGGTATAAATLAGASAADNVSKVAQKAAEATTKAMSKTMEGVQIASVEEFKKEKQAISDFRRDLAAFVEKTETQKNIPSPMFILVDELDRCRPPYAISMLERIKHLFETPRIVFLVATNSTELVHSIGAVYGAGFSAQRYLDRFFDRTYVFEKPSNRAYVEQLMLSAPIDPKKLSSPWEDDHTAFIADYFDHCDDDLRSIARVFDIIRTIAMLWEETIPIELLLLLPIAAAYVRGDRRAEPKDNAFFALSRNWQKFGHSEQGEGKDYEMSSLMAQMWQYCQQNLLKPSSGLSSNSNRWMELRTRAERSARINNIPFRSDEKRYSLTKKYPTLVRQAGRISNLTES